jgi:precorrin-6Y C5,15-methyltransferase (decarboxylating)
MADDAATQAPWLTIIGIGDNGLDSLTPPARLLFDAAATIIAPERVLKRIDCGALETIPWTFGIKETIALVMARRGTPVTILATGDPMFFGVGATLMRQLDASEMRVIPSPSAFSLAASTAWLGAAGCGDDLAAWPLGARAGFACSPGARIIALTSSGQTVVEAAQILSAAAMAAPRCMCSSTWVGRTNASP